MVVGRVISSDKRSTTGGGCTGLRGAEVLRPM